MRKFVFSCCGSFLLSPTPRPTMILKTTNSENILGKAETRLKTPMTNPEMKIVGFRPNLSVKGPMIMAPIKNPRKTAANARVP